MPDQPLLYPAGPESAHTDGARNRLVVVRHGATAWSRQGRHTGRTDVPLEDEGKRQAAEVGRRLAGHSFALIVTSPLTRARETCSLAGFADAAEVWEDLSEWDYGAYEGMTTDEIRAERPGWTLWRDGVVGGETFEQLSRRADQLLALVRAQAGDVLAFAHGHVLRVVCARWVGLGPRDAVKFALGPGALGLLGWEREEPVVVRWNDAGGDPLA